MWLTFKPEHSPQFDRRDFRGMEFNKYEVLGVHILYIPKQESWKESSIRCHMTLNSSSNSDYDMLKHEK